jgi:hypothetical protein
MMPKVASSRLTEQKPSYRKVICVTCRLKKCVGHCRFESVECPKPPKLA